MIIALQIGRKNSKGLPGKNTLNVEGSPLAEWSLKAALGSELIDEVFVSTDDPKLKGIAKNLNVTCIDRPPILNTDIALGEDVFIYCNNYLQKKYKNKIKILVLLMANAPTINTEMINKGIKILNSDETLDSVVTVSKYNMWSPIRARRITKNNLLEPFIDLEYFANKDININCDRDSQGDVWFADMGVSIIRSKNLENINNGTPPQRWMGRNIYPLKNHAGLDLDYDYQLGQVTYWLKNNGKIT